MTKENSTKPAFVSEETGRGDGFLAATHVWESSPLPPWAAAAAAAAAAAFRPMKHRSQVDRGQSTHGNYNRHQETMDTDRGHFSDTEINYMVEWRSVFADIMFHFLN